VTRLDLDLNSSEFLSLRASINVSEDRNTRSVNTSGIFVVVVVEALDVVVEAVDVVVEAVDVAEGVIKDMKISWISLFLVILYVKVK